MYIIVNILIELAVRMLLMVIITLGIALLGFGHAIQAVGGLL